MQVKIVNFSPDGRIILSYSADHTIRLWNVESAKQLIQFRCANDVKKFSSYFFFTFLLLDMNNYK